MQFRDVNFCKNELLSPSEWKESNITALKPSGWLVPLTNSIISSVYHWLLLLKSQPFISRISYMSFAEKCLRLLQPLIVFIPTTMITP